MTVEVPKAPFFFYKPGPTKALLENRRIVGKLVIVCLK
jgi:hypothetical protein